MASKSVANSARNRSHKRVVQAVESIMLGKICSMRSLASALWTFLGGAAEETQRLRSHMPVKCDGQKR